VVRRDRTSKRFGRRSRGPIESGVGVRDAMFASDVLTVALNGIVRCVKYALRGTAAFSIAHHMTFGTGTGDED
jgi:hypothetical protein